jgi:hypothetical protein
MRRRSEPQTFDERLNAEKALMEAALENTGPGPRRDLLALKLKQIENTLHLGGWLSSVERGPRKIDFKRENLPT